MPRVTRKNAAIGLSSTKTAAKNAEEFRESHWSLIPSSFYRQPLGAPTLMAADSLLLSFDSAT
jgi:hypothetical protein